MSLEHDALACAALTPVIERLRERVGLVKAPGQRAPPRQGRHRDEDGRDQYGARVGAEGACVSANSKIEWTDHSFNPWTGCTKVSPGCDHCYAEGWAKRSGTVRWGAGEQRRRTTPQNWRQPLKWNAQAEAFAEQHGRRQRVFCASLADVFDNAVDPQWRTDLFELILATPNLDWLLLTKRIGNVGNMLPVPFDFDRHYPNVWIGATVVNQAEADRDILKLLATPARVRFLSIEPMLGPIHVGAYLSRTNMPGLRLMPGFVDSLPGVDWVIAGGESGPGARPMHPNWARILRDQCNAAGVPFFFKQWGEWVPVCFDGEGYLEPEAGCDPAVGVSVYRVVTIEHQHFARVGKKAAGRLLDGVEWNEVPA